MVADDKMSSGQEPVEIDAVRLSDVIARLDPGLVTVVGPADPVDIEVRSIGIYDAHDDVASPGAALLAPGQDPTAPDAAALLDSIAAGGVCALFVKSDALTEAADAETAPGTLCVLAVDPRLGWDRLFILASAALASAERAGTLPAGQPAHRGDLFALADGIAAAVGGNTIIGDGQNRVLAYSNIGDPTDAWRRDTIVGRAPAQEWVERFRAEGVFDRMRQPGTVVHFELPDQPGFRPRRAVGVHAGGRQIGAIAVVQGDRGFDEHTDRALLDASRLAAIHLLRYESRHVLAQHAQQERLRRMLAGEEDPRTALGRLGLPAEGPYVIGVIALRDPAPDAAQRLARLADHIQLQWPANLAGAQATIDDRLYLLFAGAGATSKAVTGAVKSMVEGGSRLLGAALVGGLGEPCATPHDVGRSRAEADAVADLLSGQDVSGDVATLGEVWPHVALQQLQTVVSSGDALRLGKAARLLRHDAEHASELAASLRVYLEELGDVRAAAQRLHVHPNTLRYRVRRALELAELDLHNPVERLVTEVQLHALTDR